MWRTRNGEAEPRSERWEPPIAALVVVGVVTGALLSAAWSVERSRDRRDRAVDLTSAAPVAWTVSDDRPWEASIVRVATTQCLEGGVMNEIAGTGVVVAGAVVTNHHVVADARSVVVTTFDGGEHEVHSIERSERIDLARLDVEGVGAGLRLGDGEGSSSLTLAGFPSGDDYVVRDVSVVGTVQGWGYPDPEHALHLDVDVVPGESGSPIVDADGNVTSLLYARALSDGNGLAIAASEVRTELSRLAPTPFASC